MLLCYWHGLGGCQIHWVKVGDELKRLKTTAIEYGLANKTQFRSLFRLSPFVMLFWYLVLTPRFKMTVWALLLPIIRFKIIPQMNYNDSKLKQKHEDRNKYDGQQKKEKIVIMQWPTSMWLHIIIIKPELWKRYLSHRCGSILMQRYSDFSTTLWPKKEKNFRSQCQTAFFKL